MSNRKQRSIADILAVLIVICITIVAGVALYSMVMGKVSMFGNSAGLKIENAEITNGLVIITVKNTGTYTFSSVTFTVYYNGEPVSWLSGVTLASNLAPGQSASPSSPPAFSETVGATYTIVVTGTYNSGQTYTTSISIIGS